MLKIKKILIFFKNLLVQLIFVFPNILKYKLLSNSIYIGEFRRIAPVLIKGKGKVIFGKNVNIGVANSPNFYNSYALIEARSNSSTIIFGNNIYINNNACFISEGKEIVIGDNVLIGNNFTIYDSDFHDLIPDNRITGNPKMASVQIFNNVFIGSNVTVLKGVVIGENSIIASGSICSKSIPSDVIAGGNPCKIIKPL